MTYRGSITIDDDGRIDTLDQLSDEESSKRDVWRGLIDAADIVQGSDLVDDGETTVEAITRVVDDLTDDTDALPDVVKVNGWSALDADHDHAVEPGDIGDVPATPAARLPAITAALNHEYDTSTSMSEIRGLIVDLFGGASDATVDSYVESLIDAGVVNPHPAADPEVWASQSAKTDLRLYLYDGLDGVADSVSVIPEEHALRKSPITEVVGDDVARDLAGTDTVYLSSDAYVEGVIDFTVDLAERLVTLNYTGQTGASTVTKSERADAVFKIGMWSINRMQDLLDVPTEIDALRVMLRLSLDAHPRDGGDAADIREGVRLLTMDSDADLDGVREADNVLGVDDANHYVDRLKAAGRLKRGVGDRAVEDELVAAAVQTAVQIEE